MSTEFIKQTEARISNVLNNEYVVVTVGVLFGMYGALISPNPGANVKAFMTHPIVRFILITLLALTIRVNIRLALIIATVLVLSQMMFVSEDFSDFKKEYKSATASRILESKNHVNFRCLKIKMADLLEAFDGDSIKLQKTVKYAFKELLLGDKNQDAKQRLMNAAYAAGLPYNVNFDDESAPYIASILTQWGYEFPNGCVGV